MAVLYLEMEMVPIFVAGVLGLRVDGHPLLFELSRVPLKIAHCRHLLLLQQKEALLVAQTALLLHQAVDAELEEPMKLS